MPQQKRRRRNTSGQVRTSTHVAARAGVSTATVSRVFANPGSVSETLRQRVHQAARLLGYQPSRIARNLRIGTSTTVGVVVPDIQNPFFTGVVRGIDNVLQAAGYTLLLANSDDTLAREERMLSTLRAEGVAGIVLVPIAGRKGGYQQLFAPMLPLVAVDRAVAGLRVDLVTVANTEGSRRAVAHLTALGHREIALIGGPHQHSTASERQQGYELALREAGITVRQELIRRADFREAGGYAAMKALLSVSRPPTAVFVANDQMTLGALRAMHEAGRRIPEDIAVVSFDDMPLATSLNPPLTAVAQPVQEIGETAAELLLARITEPDRPVRHVVLETRLMIRASCGSKLKRSRVFRANA
ncbi:MAG: LacI family DNA-binding transcriptional regulator [Acidobacteria bacterium]|nr:LacI family DNA-binding transcriptional regulator [Acidobacteriota bacterium]